MHRWITTVVMIGALAMPACSPRPVPARAEPSRAQPVRPAPRVARRAGPVKVTWQHLPERDFLCTRHGPAWQPKPAPDARRESEADSARDPSREDAEEEEESDAPEPLEATYQSPFRLLVPSGMALTFQIQAKASDRSAVRYSMEGGPAGATLAPQTGRYAWTVTGTAKQTWSLTLRATAAGGATATWPMVLEVADAQTSLAWSAGLGSTTPNCDSGEEVSNLTIVDLDGDSRKDVLWTVRHSRAGDVAYAHAVCLARGTDFVCPLKGIVGQEAPKGADGSQLKVYTTPDSVKLLVFVNSCCAPLIYSFHRIKGDQLEEALIVEVNTVKDEKLTPLFDRQGRFTGIEERAGRKRTVHRWVKGKFLSPP
jgi:hypothetical protein